MPERDGHDRHPREHHERRQQRDLRGDRDARRVRDAERHLSEQKSGQDREHERAGDAAQIFRPADQRCRGGVERRVLQKSEDEEDHERDDHARGQIDRAEAGRRHRRCMHPAARTADGVDDAGRGCQAHAEPHGDLNRSRHAGRDDLAGQQLRGRRRRNQQLGDAARLFLGDRRQDALAVQDDGEIQQHHQQQGESTRSVGAGFVVKFRVERMDIDGEIA